MVNVFCQDCQSLSCLLCVDEHNTHAGHDVLTLPQAAQYFKVTDCYSMHYYTRPAAAITT